MGNVWESLLVYAAANQSGRRNQATGKNSSRSTHSYLLHGIGRFGNGNGKFDAHAR